MSACPPRARAGCGPGRESFRGRGPRRGGAVVGRWSLREKSRIVEIRRARTTDVRAIRSLVDEYTGDRRLLSKATVTLYESVQEFWVAVDDRDRVLGCGALHVMWEDLAEIRTVAVDPACRGQKIGHRIVDRLL